MKIFVRGLPKETSPVSLHAFAERILTPPWFLPLRKKIRIKACMVLKIKDLDLNTTEFHGLLEVTPYKAAVEAMERLNKSKFQGRPLLARKWHDRSYAVDPLRDPGRQDESGQSDRRRPRLVAETYVPPDFRGLRQFHREFG